MWRERAILPCRSRHWRPQGEVRNVRYKSSKPLLSLNTMPNLRPILLPTSLRTGKASSFFSCVESELSGKVLAGLFPSVRLLCRPAPIHCQDTSGDKRVFQQRDHGLRGFLGGANPPDRVQAGQPVSLGVGCLRFSNHTVNHWCLDRAKGHGVHAHPLLGKLQGSRPRQAIYSMLGGGINAETGHADLSDDRRGMHNRTAILEDSRNFMLQADE